METKKIEGKKYNLWHRFVKKKDAQKAAKQQRKWGASARVIKENTPRGIRYGCWIR